MPEKLVSRIGDYELTEILEKDTNWCAVAFMSYGSIPCDHFKPEFESFAQGMKGVYCAEIIAEEHPSMCERLEVTEVPTTLILKGGKKFAAYVGPYSHEALTDRVKKLTKV